MTFRLPMRTCALVLSAAAGPVLVQHASAAQGDYAFALTPLYRFNADLDGGGTVGNSAVILSLSRAKQIDDRWRIGASLRADWESWRFSNPVAFGGVAPWENVARIGLSVPVSYAADGGWRFAVVPSIEYAAEPGADSGKAWVWGAVASAAKAFDPNLTLGLGAGVFSQIEKTVAFPYLVIDWKIDQRWRLSNPFAAGPAGPAGIELSYAFGDNWDAGVGGAYRSYRFRLDQAAAFPDGIGESRLVPAFLRISRKLGTEARLDLYAAAALNGRLKVEDSGGSELVSQDYATAPMIGLSISGRF